MYNRDAVSREVKDVIKWDFFPRDKKIKNIQFELKDDESKSRGA